MDQQALDRLDQQIDRLLARCAQLEQDNRQLRERDAQWRGERMQLLRQRDLTQQKVEGMITRLKAMEQA